MAVLTSFLVFRGGPESKDGDEETKAALERIERRLDEVTTTASTASPERLPFGPVVLPRAGTSGDRRGAV